MKTQQFTVYESDTFKRSVCQFSKTQIALGKYTVDKIYIRQIRIRKVTIAKCAILIFTSLQYNIPESGILIFQILEKLFDHVPTAINDYPLKLY